MHFVLRNYKWLPYGDDIFHNAGIGFNYSLIFFI
jgi:hypothetical protein